MLQHKCLQYHLSTARWNSYKLSPNEPDLETWQRYQNNLTLCQSAYPLLHLVEISLRNHLQQLLRSVDLNWYKGYLDDNNVFRYEGQILSGHGKEKLKDVYKKLTKRQTNITPNEEKIVAELTFGFWVELCSKHYVADLWSYTQKRGDRVRKVFPQLFFCYMPQSNDKIITQIIYPKLKSILFLRNRIFHHEPIWDDRHYNKFSRENPNLSKFLLESQPHSALNYDLINQQLTLILNWLCEDLLQDAQSFRKA